MKTPARWLEAGGDAPKGAADLLSAAPPPPPFTDAVRYRLSLGVAHTAATPASSVWTSVLAKGAFVAAIGGASGYLVHALASKHDVPPPATPVAVAAPVVAAPVLTPPVAVEALPALQLPTAPPEAPRLKLDPRLEEAELLEKARALVASNPSQALRLTADYGRQFPKGRLGAEADLIAAQSLLALGNASAARVRARASLKRYPNGLYARQLREIAEK